MTTTLDRVRKDWDQITSQPTQHMMLDFPQVDGQTIRGDGFFSVSVMPPGKSPAIADDGYFFCFPISLVWSPNGFELTFKNTTELRHIERAASAATTIEELSTKVANAILSARKGSKWEQTAMDFWNAVKD
jgi:hypothetical protein